jgi:hypothetical protein
MAALNQLFCARSALKGDETRINRHRALDSCLGMISAQTRFRVCREENRFTLSRIMP